MVREIRKFSPALGDYLQSGLDDIDEFPEFMTGSPRRFARFDAIATFVHGRESWLKAAEFWMQQLATAKKAWAAYAKRFFSEKTKNAVNWDDMRIREWTHDERTMNREWLRSSPDAKAMAIAQQVRASHSGTFDLYPHTDAPRV